MTKHEMIERACTEFELLLHVIEGMDEQALTTRGLGEWGVREALAHITGWLDLDSEMMRRLARGERPLREGEERGTGESRNPGFAAGAAAKSGGDVVAEMRAAFDEFVAAAETVPEERFASGRTAHRLVQESVTEHLHDHRTEIESYRSRLTER
jgi:hypothetical protein